MRGVRCESCRRVSVNAGGGLSSSARNSARSSSLRAISRYHCSRKARFSGSGRLPTISGAMNSSCCIIMAAATLMLNESANPDCGKKTRSSAASTNAWDTPAPSVPMTKASLGGTTSPLALPRTPSGLARCDRSVTQISKPSRRRAAIASWVFSNTCSVSHLVAPRPTPTCRSYCASSSSQAGTRLVLLVGGAEPRLRGASSRCTSGSTLTT
mmetsp:Transcript_5788/g.14839  ORF Transcript_5788/g.14839 Transcript_5788/m.14839 type:complete len:212 (+) Transcript_5788:182-817(+)